jgi:hypothetical protein
VKKATGRVSNTRKRFLLFLLSAVALNILHLAVSKMVPEQVLSLRSEIVWVKVLVLLEGALLFAATSALIGFLEASVSAKQWSEGTLAGMLFLLVCSWGFFFFVFR